MLPLKLFCVDGHLQVRVKQDYDPAFKYVGCGVDVLGWAVTCGCVHHPRCTHGCMTVVFLCVCVAFKLNNQDMGQRKTLVHAVEFRSCVYNEASSAECVQFRRPGCQDA